MTLSKTQPIVEEGRVVTGSPVGRHTEELLIEEARQRSRRRRWRGVAVVVVLLAVILGAWWAFNGSSHIGPTGIAGGSDGPGVRPVLGASVTSTSLGVGTQVDATDMLSSKFGFAVIANDSYHPHGAVYLAMTLSGGRLWDFRSQLPRSSYVGGGGESIPTIHFANRSVGYVLSAASGTSLLFMTKNAGRTWVKVRLVSGGATWAFRGSTMAVVSQVCPTPFVQTTCRGELSIFRVGANAPIRSISIPTVANITPPIVQVLAVLSPTAIVVMEGPMGGGGEPGSTAMLFTTTSGAAWMRMTDPCHVEGNAQLLVANAHTWILSCFLGEGMSQGKSSIYRSGNGGTSWTVVNRSNDSTSTRGDVGTGGAVAMTVLLSGDRKIMFGAMGGAGGGIQTSTDGGVRWSSANLDGVGGAPQTLSTFGPRGALDDVVGGLIYRTVNGRTWSALPFLPAGPYRGLAICDARSVTTALSPTHVKGIPGVYPLIFTNHSAVACYLGGAPEAQPVVGKAPSAVGPLAIRNAGYPSDIVIVPANGGTASTTLSLALGSSENQGYPRAACGPRHATAVVVRFNAPSKFTVELPGTGGEVCTKLSATQVGYVVAGSSGLADN